MTLFGRVAPLHVDLGCGEGSFLCELAAKHPEKNFLGTEHLAGRVGKACRKADVSLARGKIDNVRVLQVESSYAVRHLLPPASAETFYLLFPDPWPKRRHHRRRLVTREFLDSICTALEENGLFHVATDHADYFKQIAQLTGASAGFAIADPSEFDLPLTKFEKRFRAQGAPIYRLSLRKDSAVM